MKKRKKIKDKDELADKNLDYSLDDILEKIDSEIKEYENEFFINDEYNDNMREEALRFARRALRLNRHDLEAELIITEITSTSLMDFIKKLEKLIKKGEKALQSVYHIEEKDKGHYWEILETRPYLLVRIKYVEALMSASMHRKAARELEEIIALSKKDNIGARYKLITIYAILEEYEKAEELFKKYKEETVHMLLPMAFMNFKRQNYVKSKNLIKKLAKVNENTERFFDMIQMGDVELLSDEDAITGYTLNSLDEYINAFNENVNLYADGIIFAEYAISVLEQNK